MVITAKQARNNTSYITSLKNHSLSVHDFYENIFSELSKGDFDEKNLKQIGEYKEITLKTVEL